MHPWNTRLSISREEVRLLVTSLEYGDQVKARLWPHPVHPRALLTLLEGLALWQGERLRVVLSAADFLGLRDLGPFGDEKWPGESALVRFDVVARARQARRAPRLPGLGDFRGLRLIPGGRS